MVVMMEVPEGMPQWPADKVERRALSSLIPYARNARTHSDAQIDQLAASIRQWGFTIPILIDEDGTIIAGHGRVLAAAKLGLSEVPVVVARNWTDEQKRAYRIADNRLTENGGWDESLLRLEVADLAGLGFDGTLMGFLKDELLSMTGAGPLAPGAPAELPKVSLSDRFGIPPFSVLNAREGWWQARKNAWIALGLRSEVGRGANLLELSETANRFIGPVKDRNFAADRNAPAAAAFGDAAQRQARWAAEAKAPAVAQVS
jgi:ParB-like chromosome segregation protein Spo0J